jgi:large subunit ribosomal protein L10
MSKPAHVAQWKTVEVERTVKFIRSKPVVGIVDITRLPAKQFQDIRRTLRDRIAIRVSKNSLLKISLEKASKHIKGVEGLEEFVDGQRALVTTDMNPFKLYKELETTKIKTPAKGGETAEDDIVVKEGETNFKPGPVIGEFQKAGIPAAIEKGKIVIKKDHTVAKKGEKISKVAANALTKLEIFPLTAGLNLVGAYENGLVFPRDSLVVDETLTIEQIGTAVSNAQSLALTISYPTRETLPILISKAHMDAMSLGLEAKLVNKETIQYLIQMAQSSAIALKSQTKAGG